MRPIRELDRAAAAGGEGDLGDRVAESGPPEVRSFARSFNEATAKLDRLIAEQRSWVSDASHQLRTPLAALPLRLENVQTTATERQHGTSPPPSRRSSGCPS
ncbi:MAG TPA: HAMP domain-containing protein [Gaiellales bacterium]|nr:HAMP domain-containing protein [Gaiellales bacterium]